MEQQPYSGVENLEVMSEARNYNEYLLSTVRSHAKPGDRILDFGAGSGQFAVPLSNSGLDVTALEPDEFLRTRIAISGVPSAATILELADDSFDYIYTLNVLEHISDDVGALRQLRSKLKPRGTLLIYVPACPALYSSMDSKVGHMRRYTRTTLLNAVRSAEFGVDKISYVDSLGFFASIVFKVFDSGSGDVNRRALRIYDRTVFPISRCVDRIANRWIGKNLLLICHR